MSYESEYSNGKFIDFALVVGVLIGTVEIIYLLFFLDIDRMLMGSASLKQAVYLVWVSIFIILSIGLPMHVIIDDYKHRRVKSQEGYLVDWTLRPKKWFGSIEWDEYIQRDSFRNFTLWYEPNRHNRSRKNIRNRIKSYSGQECEECGVVLNSDDYMFGRTRQFYIIEHKEGFYLFGIRLWSSIKDVSMYCSRHPPKMFPTD